MINKTKTEYIVGIGAANVDIYAKSRIKIKTHYDHPAHIFSTVGGVTRNILENYSLLGGKAKLFTAVGDDVFGKTIIEECKEKGIDVKNIIVKKGACSGIFTQVQDDSNDMYLAVCDMSALENITPEYINSKRKVIEKSKLVVFDPSLRSETIEALLKICKDKVDVYCDPLSTDYAKKIKPYVGMIDVIKPSESELECLAGMKIKNESDLNKAANKLIKQGVKKLYVSLGKQGIYYIDNTGKIIAKKIKPVENMKNASGAGDAMVAAIIYGTVKNMKVEKIIDYALAAGSAAVSVETPINSNLSIKLLNKILKESE